MIAKEGTAPAAFLPARTQHEMVDDQLAAAIEKVPKSQVAVWAIKEILLIDPHPWQFAPLPAQSVALPGELFFFLKKLLAGFKPLFSRDYSVSLDRCFDWFH